MGQWLWEVLRVSLLFKGQQLRALDPAGKNSVGITPPSPRVFCGWSSLRSCRDLQGATARESWFAGGCARGKAEEAQRPLPRGHCVSWDASSCLLPRGRTGLGFKRLKEMWKGCLRSALLVWVLGRHILSLGSFSKLAFTGGWVGEGEKGRRLCPGPARWGTAFLSASLTFHGNPSPVG